MPVPVPAPGVETAVVTGFPDGVEYITAFNPVAAEGALGNIDAGSGGVTDGAVAHGDAVGHGNLDAGGLLFHKAHIFHQAVLNQAVFGIIVGFGALFQIQLPEGLGFVVLEQGTADAVSMAHEAQAAGPDPLKMAAGDVNILTVAVHKDTVGADIPEIAPVNAAASGFPE